MKYLTYADRSVLIGDEAADLLIRFSAILAETGHADAVFLNALDEGGQTVVANFVIGSGTNLMSASVESELPEPENAEGTTYMNDKIEELTTPPAAVPSDEAWRTEEPLEL